MNNFEAVYNLCNAILNTFYPDSGAIKLALLNHNVDADAEAVAKDPNIYRCAVGLVLGYIEGSRSENGVSTSVRSEEAVKRALRHWAQEYGLDPDEELSDSIIELKDITKCW